MSEIVDAIVERCNDEVTKKILETMKSILSPVASHVENEDSYLREKARVQTRQKKRMRVISVIILSVFTTIANPSVST